MNEQNNIKEALNEITVPAEKLDAILTDTFTEKKKAKNFIFKRWMKYSAAVAILSFVMVTSANVSPAFANFITQIPIMGHAFEYFILQEDYYEAYEEISTDIGISSESNGVEIVIEKAFFDGNSITLGFIIRTEENLISAPSFEKFPSVQNERVRNFGYDGEYVEGIGFVGMMNLNDLVDTNDIVNIVWKPKSIIFDEQTIDGDWEFSFSLEKLEGTAIEINEQVSKEGVTVQLMDAVKTDVNLTINYLQDVHPSVHDRWAAVEAELFAIDNLGNEYEVPYNGGFGTEGADSGEDLTWNATIHGLNPDATSITFYPFAHLSNIGDSIRIDFDPIIVELE